MSLFLASLVGVGRAAVLPLLPDEVVDKVTGKPTCVCPNDPDLDRLRDLIRQGIGQRQASLMLWDPSHVDLLAAPQYGATRLTWSIWIRLEVRRIANRARRSLGQPEEPETIAEVMA